MAKDELGNELDKNGNIIINKVGSDRVKTTHFDDQGHEVDADGHKIEKDELGNEVNKDGSIKLNKVGSETITTTHLDAQGPKVDANSNKNNPVGSETTPPKDELGKDFLDQPKKQGFLSKVWNALTSLPSKVINLVFGEKSEEKVNLAEQSAEKLKILNQDQPQNKGEIKLTELSAEEKEIFNQAPPQNNEKDVAPEKFTPPSIVKETNKEKDMASLKEQAKKTTLNTDPTKKNNTKANAITQSRKGNNSSKGTGRTAQR